MNTQFLMHEGGKIAYDDAGTGPLVLCAPSMGDLRGEYRFQLMLRAPRPQQLTLPLAAALQEFRWPDGVQAAVDMDAQALL